MTAAAIRRRGLMIVLSAMLLAGCAAVGAGPGAASPDPADQTPNG